MRLSLPRGLLRLPRLALLASILSLLGPTSPACATPASRHVPSPTQRTRLAALAVPFIANTGQVDRRVAFYARTFAGTVFVTGDGTLVLSLPARTPTGNHTGNATRVVGAGRRVAWVLSDVPVGGKRLRPRGVRATPTRVAVFHGRDVRHWRRDLPTFAAVNMGQPWPGVGYEVRAHGDSVERVFTVAPGARAGAIRMQLRGAIGLRLRSGALVAQTGSGRVRLSKPLAYQIIRGRRVPVRVAYRLAGDRYGFVLGAYDKAHAVVIDPLVQATYLGGDGRDEVSALALGPGGQVYVAGSTGSTNFPGTTGGAYPAGSGKGDAFVAELSGDLKNLIQATYLGGSSDDAGDALAVDGVGNVYLAGDTLSSDFPGTSGGAQPSYVGGAGNTDVFVAELSADLKNLVQATYLGGTGAEVPFAIAVDGHGVYVTGWTTSTDFPATAGGAQAASGGGTAGTEDAFVALLQADLKPYSTTRGPIQSTYLGGSGNDEGHALTLSSTGDVYVAGYTGSSADFPVTSGAAQPFYGGGTSDAFVAELTPGLAPANPSSSPPQGPIAATYLGGIHDDSAYGLALGAAGQIYVAGATASNDFPGVAGGAQPTYTWDDGFVSELKGDLSPYGLGQGPIQSTYLGGSGLDGLTALTVDSGGYVYVAGFTTSPDFPGMFGAAQSSFGGGTCDAVAAVLSGDLTRLMQATYLGGTGDDYALAAAIGAADQLYVAGATDSTDLPGTSGGAQAAHAADNGNQDGFVAVYNGLAAPPSPGGGGGTIGFLGLSALLCLAVVAGKRSDSRA